MKIKSNLQPHDYSAKEVVRIVNPKQYLLYIKNGIYPIDVYTTIDDSDQAILTMIFEKDDTAELYQKWRNYELT